ncbi:MAG: hypothetical protein A3F94_00605 [Candidatus Spechtbacteria bacterium RIFCSPLOWO2_12_FULL_38_22]|uniref:DUF458 domain-containing protein n=1 Tax=Candidatus Spechtbacteria bacterium RIFCSPLOWO2_12_FULL_38_22 TaxID=1802165 RepID=A0A1G2HHB5_9BACT|nr:MAG: hypothetical protein A2728_02805 [Candidatus Spechtbacteria bacterium RIFCSPHIGHO2_01_FULL_38_11]OGZ59626.1 MAG: hypothetical protein A3A00_00295 [Candidatus Spechtbacteria bacterium RIFCSPLOWO2_01_FULL_38_20]OGZ60031.1 MAG: hypothetical protein A3E58_01645 [Candidatus Spechtbacteria bacterium RIFCSPHIGHO2_12_FULL_38_30]OGZ61894.1 MAG: hypothetical protein A3F94_00605 [Candidatus Spechtbacteria bacterium RIFCSPLOWO2_12_FULL_38_22]
MQKDTQYDFSSFVTVSREQKSFGEMLQDIRSYVDEAPAYNYRVIVGTDSEGYGEVVYATAVVVHRVGNGARAYICKNRIYTPHRVLRDKIYNESMLSLALAQKLVPFLADMLGKEFVQSNFAIHSDIGNSGDTREMIKEVIGMVTGYGFQVEIKPESYAASSVADRFVVPPKKTISLAV